MTDILTRRGDLNKDMHAGRTNVNMKTEVGVKHLQAKEHQRLPANLQKPGQKPGAKSPSQPTGGTNPANTLILAFQPPEL